MHKVLGATLIAAVAMATTAALADPNSGFEQRQRLKAEFALASQNAKTVAKEQDRDATARAGTKVTTDGTLLDRLFGWTDTPASR